MSASRAFDTRLFLWVVRRGRRLAGIPTLPYLFDALLLAWTSLTHPSRVAAMELLEDKALQIDGVTLRTHRFGGIEFHHETRGELGHVHGHGLLDVRLTRKLAGELLEEGRVRRHHVFPDSRWISFQLGKPEDVSYAIQLLEGARQAGR
ncbi:MAG TPA: luciferase family protein [Chthoniobacterales bacterium]|nr:luciferase family protein [Chthoniobacterales bacterium]